MAKSDLSQLHPDLRDSFISTEQLNDPEVFQRVFGERLHILVSALHNPSANFKRQDSATSAESEITYIPTQKHI